MQKVEFHPCGHLRKETPDCQPCDDVARKNATHPYVNVYFDDEDLPTLTPNGKVPILYKMNGLHGVSLKDGKFHTSKTYFTDLHETVKEAIALGMLHKASMEGK